jgi:hypothetical protein
MNSGRMIGSGLVWQFESKYVRQLLDGGKWQKNKLMTGFGLA